MPKPITPDDAREMRQALSDLLGTFLSVAPRHADLSTVNRARDVLRRIPPVIRMEGMPSQAIPAQPVDLEFMITGSD